MEMWQLGFSIDRSRLLLFILIDVPLLVGISHYAGFEETNSWFDDLLDALAAFGIGVLCSAVFLFLFSIVHWGMSQEEIIGKIALQSVPASIGAVLSRKQLGNEEKDKQAERRNGGYSAEAFLMAVGALFFAFNVAPTDEVTLIAYRMNEWHALALIFVSIGLLHSFVYSIGFAGQETAPQGATAMGLVIRYAIAGYAIAFAISLYVLWTFGRIDETSLDVVTRMTIVLAFPAALGAAVARLIV
jgi:putative integral membrane protein (TIGR02587 family)